MENPFRLQIRLGVYATIYILVCLVAFIFSAKADSSIKSETFDDGVEHWYLSQPTDSKSFLTQKFEEIYRIVFSADGPQPFGKSIAFLVGVSKYHYLSPQLPSVENDLNKMREFLLESAGFDELYIAKGDIVNREVIEKYIKDVIPKRMNENDRLLFYYSGHGADGQGKTGYMQFSKARKATFWGMHVLAINDLEDWSREIGIKHMLFIVDCCASGLAFTAKSPGDESKTAKLLLQTLSGNGSRTVLTAGTADEKTYAIEGRKTCGNGVFTKALLNAFESRSISNKHSGLLTISGIHADIEKEMAKFRVTYGKSTTPRMWKLQEMDYRGTFVFLNPKAKSATLTDEQAEVLGVSPVAKGQEARQVDSGAGIIEISSLYEGKIYIDGHDEGSILKEQTRQFMRQPVGKHYVEIKGSKAEAKEVIVKNGSIAYISFGLKSPIDKTGSQPVGALIIESLEQLSGDIFIDNYKIGFLEENDQIEIHNLIVGRHQYRIVGIDKSATGTVEIEPNRTSRISVRPAPPQNLRIVQ